MNFKCTKLVGMRFDNNDWKKTNPLQNRTCKHRCLPHKIFFLFIEIGDPYSMTCIFMKL